MNDIALPIIPQDLSIYSTDQLAIQLMELIAISRQIFYKEEQFITFKEVPAQLIADIGRVQSEYSARLLLTTI